MALSGKASEGTPPLWDGVLELMKAAQKRNKLLWTVQLIINFHIDLFEVYFLIIHFGF